MLKRLDIIAPWALAVLLTTMLIGARFGFTWAGGDGYKVPLTAVVTAMDGGDRQVGDVVKRGETVKVGNGYGELKIGGSVLAIDANTDVEIISLSPSGIVLRVRDGRIAVQHGVDAQKVTVRAGPAELTILKTGWLSVVDDESHGTVTVAPVGTPVAALLPGTESVVSTTPFDYVYWWTPPGIQNAVFNPTIGDHALFYERFLKAAGLAARE